MPRKKKNTVYIGVGSNLGDRRSYIDKALRLLDYTEGIKLKKTSSIYETEPVGGPPQGMFLNGVCKVETTLDPIGLLDELQRIEKSLGRKRGRKNHSRTIDLDILLFGDKKIHARRLKVPHPRMHKREFVKRGLAEVIR